MKNRLFLFPSITLILLCAVTLHAKPRKGFYEGPYINLIGGIVTFDWDVNQRTLIHEGRELEPFLGLGFGWNVSDIFAPELSIRYSTSRNGGRREHIIASNIGFVVTLLVDRWIQSEQWKALPFLKPGAAIQVAVLPGDVLASDNRVTSKGAGPSIGGGLRILFNEYLYFGIETLAAFLYHEGQNQGLDPGGNTKIYQGGWKKQLEAFLSVGVHF